MKNELKIKRCEECGAIVGILKDCTCEDCGIKCCGKDMRLLKPNSEEAAVEKHVPTYELIEDEIYVTVNHVMDKDHYIEWIAVVEGNKKSVITLYPEQNAEARFKYVPGSTIYAYCNKHGIWKMDVE